ncbi:TPA: hypothetical protein N0F65_011672 [Lagenidium giganteum]|uniref:ubiquitinyl hydrolase 1 n=1 Tax=Lagenidium giganteum TaxID=4803 RepID=A0AAV2Z7D8_9STRA|nr:TPA: hypothetical protein N0F65_011672 [Lagenidium giganteum]
MWKLRLRGPKGKAAVVSIDPDAPLESLCAEVVQQLGLKSKKNLTFKCGFPPKPVVINDMSGSVQSLFANNDTMVVDVAAPGTQASAPAAPAPARAPGGRHNQNPVRAAAKRKEPTAPKVGVHSLHSRGGSSSSSSRRMPRGQGHVLGGPGNATGSPSASAATPASSEASRAAASPEPARKYRRTRAIELTSKEDVGVKLVQAVTGGATDRASKFFRAATKNAVDYQYQLTRASARLKAALGQDFKVEPVETAQRANTGGQAAEMRILFKEGVRKWTDEVVAVLNPTELRAILKYVLISGGETGKEMLKPFNMAQCSSRVFWNIARLYQGDVAAGLAALVPEEDWSYLDIRTRQMSKKAMEAKVTKGSSWPSDEMADTLTVCLYPCAVHFQANEEYYRRWQRGEVVGQQQQRQHEEIVIDDDDDDEMKHPDLNAEEKEELTEQNALRAAMARAALARLDDRAEAPTLRVPVAVTVQVETSKKIDDIDEDVEDATTVYCDLCDKARILSTAEAKVVGATEEGDWTCQMLHKINRSGNCDELDDEIEQVAGKDVGNILVKSGVMTRSELADTTVALVLSKISGNRATLAPRIEALINEVRLDEVNDWMEQTVGSPAWVDALELEKLGTPADLVATPPDFVIEALAGHADGANIPSMDEVCKWQDQARAAITARSWMAEWRTL